MSGIIHPHIMYLWDDAGRVQACTSVLTYAYAYMYEPGDGHACFCAAKTHPDFAREKCPKVHDM